MNARPHIFQRYPRATLTFIVAAVFLILDFGAAQLEHEVQSRSEPPRRSYRIKSPVYDHDLLPRTAAEGVSWGPKRYSFFTNSLGFRDRKVWEVPLVSPKRRVVFLGDSFTEGIGIEYSRTFVGQIAQAEESKGIEVLNSGVSSYSPIIYYRKTRYLLETAGLKFDEVVVLIDVSDIKDEVAYRFDNSGNVVHDETVRIPDPQDPPEGLARRIWNVARKNSATLSGLQVLSKRFRSRGEEPPQWPPEGSLCTWTFDKTSDHEFAERGLALAKEHMTRLHDLLKQNNIGLSIVVYPWPCQIRNGDFNSKQSRFWGEWAKEQGVKFLDLFPAFAPIPGTPRGVYEKYFIPGDVHWNEVGHELVAKRILEAFDFR